MKKISDITLIVSGSIFVGSFALMFIAALWFRLVGYKSMTFGLEFVFPVLFIWPFAVLLGLIGFFMKIIANKENDNVVVGGFKGRTILLICLAFLIVFTFIKIFRWF